MDITVQHLTCDYGGGRGVFDISFCVAPGETMGFLGPNGAGKTTTILHLMGFVRQKQGSCQIGGQNCFLQRDKIQAQVGYIPGEMKLPEQMSGEEYLRFVQRYRRQPAPKMQQLLATFEVDLRGKIGKMSKGSRQKLGIVAALMFDAPVLILDEPTSGLDPLMQQAFVQQIESEQAAGKTILLCSHQFEEVERTCQRVAMIRAGRLVALDRVEKLCNRHVRRYTVTLDTPQQALAFAGDFGGEAEGCQVSLQYRPNMEEIFMQYYREEQK